jgi:hypothetical protein
LGSPGPKINNPDQAALVPPIKGCNSRSALKEDMTSSLHILSYSLGINIPLKDTGLVTVDIASLK